ncbi:MAG TPA: adenylosuccinate synthetase [Desulfurococcaceae archaeon]|nr:adenylosuccinate synthetase [Desulfurococcaceae archaeon]
MPLAIVVGGFFGDEGKGKVAAYLALKDKPAIAVRCGAINAGHTVVYNGRKWKLRSIPSFFVNPTTRLMIASGALVRLDVLFKEIEETNAKGRLVIDKHTGVIEQRHVEEERRNAYLSGKIGSTLQGVGAAMSDRVMRKLKLAEEYPELKDMVGDVALEVNNALDRGELVYIEGTQGTFLSLYHGTYPYVTSRDTTASAFASEVGVGPRRVDDVIVVFKAYVTRVGGGPLPGELSLEEIERRGWIEKATVTGRTRRAAPFNVELARRAIMLNSASQIAITKLDVLFPEAKRVREWSKLPVQARRWIEELEEQLKTPITLIGTGEEALDMVDRRRELGLMR